MAFEDRFRFSVHAAVLDEQEHTGIRLSTEHSDFRWTPIDQLAGVQATRVRAARDYDGALHARVF